MKTLKDLQRAYDGSYYTIVGAGGDLQEWITGYEDLLKKEDIGKPTKWFTTTGKKVNAFIRSPRPEDQFKPDLTFLMFPLDGLEVGKLAMFRLRMEDRWFADLVDNSRRGPRS